MVIINKRIKILIFICIKIIKSEFLINNNKFHFYEIINKN